jgi:2-hydroxycyclohexanecarboxyl-CoA dehydrogenase
VTGGANGIGAAVVRRLAEEGCVVGILDRDVAAGERLVAEVVADGGRASLHAADITDYDAVVRAVQSFESAAGPVACLVNNAGWDRAANFLDTTPELWRAVVGINLFGPLNVSHLVLRGMAERGFGRVVNIASDAGRVGSTGEAVYAGSKGAVIAFSKTLARELARHGITVNVVCPGLTETPLLQGIREQSPKTAKVIEAVTRAIPLGRVGTPQDVAEAVVFLASPGARYITGQTLSVSGGLTMC